MTYTFDDVVAALNSVEPYDWAGFLRQRLESHGPGAPLDGITRGGYKLVYTDTPTEYFRSAETRRSITDLTYSLGLVVGREGRITDVLWDGPAFKNALTVGMQIVSVNGITYEPNRLKDAIGRRERTTAAIECVIKSGDRVKTVRFDYHDGLRYPRLERIVGAPARLDEILAPRP